MNDSDLSFDSCVIHSVKFSVCLKRVGEFSKKFAGEKDLQKTEDGIKKICKTYTDKADKRCKLKLDD
jgi:hypothetical protein